MTKLGKGRRTVRLTFFANVAYAGVVNALLVEFSVMFKRVAGFADAVEVVETTFSFALRFVGHAILGYLVTVSKRVIASCRWVRTPHIGICESGRFRVVDGDAVDVAVLDVTVGDVIACDDVELAMLVACVRVVTATERLDGVIVSVVATAACEEVAVVEVGAAGVANGAHSSGMSRRWIPICSHPFV
jgi:hypothetical protein